MKTTDKLNLISELERRNAERVSEIIRLKRDIARLDETTPEDIREGMEYILRAERESNMDIYQIVTERIT